MTPLGNNLEPGQLYRKYDRRARAAAWAAGCGLSFLFLGVEAAGAKTEFGKSANTERSAELSPQAFIAKVDKELAAAGSRLKSAPDVKVASNKAGVGLDDTYLYVVTIPSKNHSGHYDFMQMQIKKGRKIPLAADIMLDADSKVYSRVKKYRENYLVVSTGDSSGSIPGLVELEFVDAKGINTSYTARMVEPSAPSSSDYATNPSGVAARFNTFFNQANRILAADINQ